MKPSPLLTQADIETEITRLSAQLEETTYEYRDAIRNARNAEADYRVAYAKAFARQRMQQKPPSEKTCEMQALVETENLFRVRLSTDAIERYMEERCRTLRSMLDAVRTLSANVRAQT